MDETDNASSSSLDKTVDAGSLTEKLRRQKSFTKAKLAEPIGIRAAVADINKEHSEHGQVKKDVYWRYIEAASKSGFALFLFATVTQQIASVFANLALRSWGEHNREMGDNSGIFKYLTLYGAFSASAAILGGVASISMLILCALRSARLLHDQMLGAVMRAPLSFFELTPTGRLVSPYISCDDGLIDLGCKQHTKFVLARHLRGGPDTCTGLYLDILFGFDIYTSPRSSKISSAHPRSASRSL